MIKVGSLVRYIPSASSQFKWEKHVNVSLRNPGLVIEEVETKGTTTRRFLVRWKNGKFTEEWISYLEPFTIP
tara:strand:+ start:181 stop:396 length:216 start_codon:yes stop_codon:yes gene_type:complete